MRLDLDTSAKPAADSRLRDAFRRLDISRRLSYEQAMADTIWNICIRNLSEATARRLGRTGARPA